MRILFTTRGSSGHLLPLAPVAHACARAGHEVLVAAQAQHAANVERTGLPLAPVADPPPEEWMPMLASFGTLDLDSANTLMVRDFFAGIDSRAALPDLLRIAEEWRPALIVRESWEFTSAVVGERLGIPLARVGLGLAEMERRSIGLAAGAVDATRAAAGLPPDPGGDRLGAAPYLTATPEPLEAPGDPVAPIVYRHRIGPRHGDGSPPDPWPGGGDPLVYLSFGTVTGEPHLPYFPGLYRAAIDALAALPVRLLVTAGQGRDLGRLGPLPGNVRMEGWVAQDQVLPHAAAMVCHGGYGSTLGALGHGVPLVVLPLFSIDQWVNAAAVHRAGAGVGLDGERHTRQVLALPTPETLAGLAPAVTRVLADPAFGRAAGAVAAAMAALPPVDASVRVLEAVAGR